MAFFAFHYGAFCAGHGIFVFAMFGESAKLITADADMSPFGVVRMVAAFIGNQPGFLWASRYKLAEPDKDGWPGYAMIYGVKSAEALRAYFASPATKRYVQERAQLGLDPLLRMDRNWGTLEIAVDAPAKAA